MINLITLKPKGEKYHDWCELVDHLEADIVIVEVTGTNYANPNSLSTSATLALKRYNLKRRVVSITSNTIAIIK